MNDNNPLGEDRETEDGTDSEFDQVDPLYMETVLDKNDPLLDSSRVDEDDVFADEIDRVDEFYDTESNFREDDLDRRRDFRKKNIEDVENTPVKPRRNYDDDTKKTVGFYEKMGFRKFSDLGLTTFFKTN